MITETGCYIDGSHRSSIDFTALVIEMAHDYGFELEWEAFLRDLEWLRTDGEEDDDRLYEILDALDWTYYQALDYLNDNTREGLYWEVIDQSLYLVEDEDV